MRRGSRGPAFYAHSWRSDWNHGNAHFLRGPVALEACRAACPALRPELYDADAIDLDAALDGTDVVVHGWTAPALVARIGRHRRDGGRYTLLFHDTHHRSVSRPDAIAGLALADYDGASTSARRSASATSTPAARPTTRLRRASRGTG